MTRAPSNGVSCFFSTALRTSLMRRSPTCHFGSMVGPNSVGFIEANWWTRDFVTASAMTPPWLGERVHIQGAKGGLSRFAQFSANCGIIPTGCPNQLPQIAAHSGREGLDLHWRLPARCSQLRGPDSQL